MAAALTQIGPEELGRVMFEAGVVDDLRQFVDLASAALAVAERLVAEREAAAGAAVLAQEPRP